MRSLSLKSLTLGAWGTLYFVTIIASSACTRRSDQSRAEDGAALRAGFDTAATRLLAGLRADNADSVLTLMADEVMIMPPNEPVLKGKAAVAAWYQQLLTQVRTSSLTISDREVTIGGDYATDISSFEWVLAPVAGGEPITERGTYMQLWHRGPGGQWLMSRELWNSLAPLPTPAGS
jgi:ketosteroid isomerase-like protein